MSKASVGFEDIASLNIPESKKKYIMEKLNPVLEELTTDVVVQFPDDPADYILQWLIKKSGADVAASDPEVAKKNEALKTELKDLKHGVCMSVMTGVQLQQTSGASNAATAADEESAEGSDDDLDDIPEFKPKSAGARMSVSAEAYGEWNKKTAFTPPVHPKSEQQKKGVQDVLKRSFLFSQLEEKDFLTVVDAMEEVKLGTKERVINQGDQGDYLFVVEKGTLNCVRKDESGVETVVKSVGAADVFGELALLYNCPRAASVESVEACTLWKLDRNTFNYIVKDAAAAKRNAYEAFLAKVVLLEGMDAYERSQVADALKVEMHTDGTAVIKQGEKGDTFYIIEKGTAKVEKDGKEVMQYQPGDFFGELALLTSEVRAASVITTSEVKLLSLDRRTFQRMLGGLEGILQRQVAKYR